MAKNKKQFEVDSADPKPSKTSIKNPAKDFC
jgi:hypothetical protein